MADKNSVYGRRKISVERAQQAMKLRGMSRLETAIRMGMINGGRYKKDNDSKGCYKALSKALADGYMSDKMLEKFCKEVNVDPYVIKGDADKDLKKLYEINCIICDCGSFEDYKKSLDLNLYPYKGDFPRINETYEPDPLNDSGLISAYNQLMNYLGVQWIDKQSSDDEPDRNVHSEEYYLLMVNILDAARNCIEEFGKKSQKVMFFNPEKARNMINNMLVELYNQGLIEASVAT